MAGIEKAIIEKIINPSASTNQSLNQFPVLDFNPNSVGIQHLVEKSSILILNIVTCLSSKQ